MNRFIGFGFALFLGLFLSSPLLGFAQEISSQQLIQEADHFRGYPQQSFRFTVTVTSIAPDKEERSSRLSVSVRDGASLVKFEAPVRDKGKAMLFKERELWFHTPKTKRLIRLSPVQRLLGEASNGDVAGTQFAYDYHAETIGTETIQGIPCYVLDLKAVDRKVTYARLKYWIAQSDHRPMKSEHYAVSGKLLKIVHYEAFTKTPDGFKLAKLRILNPLKAGQQTLMVYSAWQAVDLPASMFQKTYLKRLR